jgi:endonuclease/exonuclease/phosphatase (EEP) superfamily protein YafD
MKGAYCVQVQTLLKGLEKIAASADIPMLVAGDFNSVPGRLVHLMHFNDQNECLHCFQA